MKQDAGELEWRQVRGLPNIHIKVLPERKEPQLRSLIRSFQYVLITLCRYNKRSVSLRKMQRKKRQKIFRKLILIIQQNGIFAECLLYGKKRLPVWMKIVIFVYRENLKLRIRNGLLRKCARRILVMCGVDDCDFIVIHNNTFLQAVKSFLVIFVSLSRIRACRAFFHTASATTSFIRFTGIYGISASSEKVHKAPSREVL